MEKSNWEQLIVISWNARTGDIKEGSVFEKADTSDLLLYIFIFIYGIDL